MDGKNTLTVRELMGFLSIGRKKAYELVNSTGFPSFRIGRKVLISMDGLVRWMKQQEEKRNENI